MENKRVKKPNHLINFLRSLAVATTLFLPVDPAVATQEVSAIPQLSKPISNIEKKIILEILAIRSEEKEKLVSQGLARKVNVDYKNISQLQAFINNWVKEQYRGKPSEEMSAEEVLDSMTLQEGDSVIFIVNGNGDDPENLKLQIKIRKK